MSSLKSITHEHIIKAAALLDQRGIPKENESQEWDVIVNGKAYPPKHLVCVANRFPNMVELSPNETRTGKAQEHLASLGFKIVPK